MWNAINGFSRDLLLNSRSKSLFISVSVKVVEVLFPKRERVFHRGIQTPRNMKARGRRPSAFIVSRCLDTPMKHEARVLEITSHA